MGTKMSTKQAKKNKQKSNIITRQYFNGHILLLISISPALSLLCLVVVVVVFGYKFFKSSSSQI